MILDLVLKFTGEFSFLEMYFYYEKYVVKYLTPFFQDSSGTDFFKSTNIMICILLVEVMIILPSILLSITIKDYLNYKRKKQERLKKKIWNKIFSIWENNEILKYDDFPMRYYKLEYFIDNLEEIESTSKLECNNLQHLLLSCALNYAQSRDWKKRVCAARYFAVYPSIKYEAILFKFLRDSVPLIRIIATVAITRLSSEEGINRVINAIAIEARYTRLIYKNLLTIGNDLVTSFIKKRLRQERLEYFRKICIDILKDKFDKDDYELIISNLETNNKELKISAIRCFSNFKDTKSFFILRKYLKDKDWEVRAVTCNVFGELNLDKSIPYLLESIRDKVWWVRMNSAMALKKIGGKGIIALKELEKADDLYAYEISRYVLSLELEEEKRTIIKKAS